MEEKIKEILKHYRWGIQRANQYLNINYMFEAKEQAEREAISKIKDLIQEEERRMIERLRVLHKQGWDLADVIQAEDIMGGD